MRKAASKGTKSGNPIGRPRVDAETEGTIRRLLRGGTGINKTAATVGVGTATVQRVRAEMGPFESKERERRKPSVFWLRKKVAGRGRRSSAAGCSQAEWMD
jgi:transposase-like protein